MPNLKVLVASAAFYVPLIRELWLASYCISASRSVATNALRKGPTAMLIYPGGMDEVRIAAFSYTLRVTRGKNFL